MFLRGPLALLFCFIVSAAGCGGGGGETADVPGGTGLVPQTISYAGLTTPATITSVNAMELALGAYNGVELARPVSTMAALRESDSSAAQIQLLSFATTLERAFVEAQPNGQPKNLRALQNPVLPGECGGTVAYALESDDTSGEFSGSMTFTGYCVNDVSYSGNTKAKGKLKTASQSIQQLELTLDTLEITSAKGVFGAKGTLTYSYFDQSTRTISLDVMLFSASSGKTYWYKNYNIVLSAAGVSIFGTFLHPDHGYVVVSTVMPLALVYQNEGFVHGELLVTGANGTSAQIVPVTSELFKIFTDTNGDKTFDDITNPISWVDFQPVLGTTPSTPLNVSANVASDSYRGAYVTVTWAPVLNADGYRVYIAPNANLTPDNFRELAGNMYLRDTADMFVTVGPGTYYIIVTAVNLFGESDRSAEVSVVVVPQDPTVDPSKIKSIVLIGANRAVDDGYVPGEVTQLQAVAKDGYGSERYMAGFQWQSSNATVASVDSTGTVTALTAGSTEITASYDGVTSATYLFSVRGDIKPIALAVTDMVYVPETDKIYASVPSRFGVNGNTIAVVNPATAAVEKYVFVGSEPSKLGLAPDHTTIYVALDGARAIRKFDVATQTAGDQFVLTGSDSYPSPTVLDIEVSPANSTTITVLQTGYYSSGNVAIYDNGVRRAVMGDATYSDVAFTSELQLVGRVQFGSNGRGILETIEIDGTGVVRSTNLSSTSFQGAERFTYSEGNFYFSDGKVFNLPSNTVLGTYTGMPGGAPMVVDEIANRVYKFGQTSSSGTSILVYERDRFLPVGTINVRIFDSYYDNYMSNFNNLLKWGDHRFAVSVPRDKLMIFNLTNSP